MNAEKKIAELEARIKKLEQCKHEYEIVGGRNTNYVTYFSGCNAYHKCIKCGHRRSC
jgi:hypothetical protein